MSYEYRRQKRMIKESHKYIKMDFFRSFIIDNSYCKYIRSDNEESYLKIFDFRWKNNFFDITKLNNTKNPFAFGYTPEMKEIMVKNYSSSKSTIEIINILTNNQVLIVEEKFSVLKKIKNFLKKRRQHLKIVLASRNINMDCNEIQLIKDTNIFTNEELETIEIMIYEYKNEFKNVYKISLKNNKGYITDLYSNSGFLLKDKLFRECFVTYVKKNLTIEDVDSDSIMNNAREYINLIKLTNY